MTTNTEIPATLSAAGSGKGSKGLLSRLKRDDKGIAAVEFAMIVPIMFFLFIGSIEFSRAITVDRRVTQAASSTADLVARVDRISSSEMGDVMNIVGALLAPYSQTPLTIELRSVHANASDATNTQARWKCTFSGGTTNCQSGLTESLHYAGRAPGRGRVCHRGRSQVQLSAARVRVLHQNGFRSEREVLSEAAHQIVCQPGQHQLRNRQSLLTTDGRRTDTGTSRTAYRRGQGPDHPIGAFSFSPSAVGAEATRSPATEVAVDDSTQQAYFPARATPPQRGAFYLEG